jgi:uncharacterized protein
MAPLAVAFSGGVDSSLLVKVAHDRLKDRCSAVTVDAPYHFRQELADAVSLATGLGVHHLLLTFDPAAVPGLMHNPPDRCYLCKRALLTLCHSVLPSAWTLIDGSTADDLQMHRPGSKALKDLGVRSPLAEAGFTKQDIRMLSRRLGLPTWDKPAQSCLLTRFPYNTLITADELVRVEQCETAIKALGIRTIRVRSLGNLARLEFGHREQAQAMLPVMKQKITGLCRQAGFIQVEVDPAGYRSGSMDQN